jgi:hypothetical protein
MAEEQETFLSHLVEHPVVALANDGQVQDVAGADFRQRARDDG